MSPILKGLTDIEWDTSTSDFKVTAGDIVFISNPATIMQNLIVDQMLNTFDSAKRITPEHGFEGKSITDLTNSYDKQKMMMYLREIIDPLSFLIYEIVDITITFPTSTTVNVVYEFVLNDPDTTSATIDITYNISTQIVTVN